MQSPIWNGANGDFKKDTETLETKIELLDHLEDKARESDSDQEEQAHRHSRGL